MVRGLKIIGLFFVLIFLVLIAFGLFLKSGYKSQPAPGRLVDVGGFNLHIHCTGQESGYPPVILENGLGMASFMYHWIQNDLSKITKVCSYDRPGIVWSEPSGKINDGENISGYLHTLLKAIDIEKPFVLVGHSAAGLLMRVYEKNYPDEVAGIAFLDASHPEQKERLGLHEDELKLSGWLVNIYKLYSALGLNYIYNPVFQGDPPDAHFPPQIMRYFEEFTNSPYLPDGLWAEVNGFDPSLLQAGTTGSLGNKPILVIAAQKKPEQNEIPEYITPEKLMANSLVLQKEIAALSTDNTFICMDKADHNSLIFSNVRLGFCMKKNDGKMKISLDK